jgi:hypothetical protein
MVTIEESIKNAYYDEEDGFGSMAKTLKDAKKYNDKVTIDDVKNWFAKHIGTKRQLKGYNSFIANQPYEYYQMDLFFFEDLSKETKTKQPYGLLMVDSFSKYCQVVPVKSKQIDDVLEGIKELIKLMQAKPDFIYSDEEGAFVSNKVQEYFRSEDIKHIITRAHAPLAERMIKTLKNWIYKRVEGLEDPVWTNHLKTVLNNYNNKHISRATGFTPNTARLAKHRTEIKMRMLLNAKRNRKYPNISVDDKVRVYRKKSLMDKERVPVWSKVLHTVEKIIEEDGQKLYKVSGYDKAFVRSEILLVND